MQRAPIPAWATTFSAPASSFPMTLSGTLPDSQRPTPDMALPPVPALNVPSVFDAAAHSRSAQLPTVEQVDAARASMELGSDGLNTLAAAASLASELSLQPPPQAPAAPAWEHRAADFGQQAQPDSSRDLLALMTERDEAGKVQNVYFNKNSSAWFFRITFNNKHITFSVAGLSKCEHAVVRECLMAVLQDTTKSNSSPKILTHIASDIAILQAHGPACSPERLYFSKALPIYNVFMGRADAWLAKLSKERGPSQAVAVAARAFLAPVSANFLTSTATAAASAAAAAAAAASISAAEASLPNATVSATLQAAVDAGTLSGVRQTTRGCAVAVPLPNGKELELEAPGMSPRSPGAALRELLAADTALALRSQLPLSLRAALAADLSRCKQAAAKIASVGTAAETSLAGQLEKLMADGSLEIACPDCIPSIAAFIELQPSWFAQLLAAGVEPMDLRPKPVVKEDAPIEQRATDSASELLAMFAQLPLHLLEKYQPRAGSVSVRGTSQIWRELRERESTAGLRGVNPHQNSNTSFSISIPGFNTTLSRVDKLENAVVSEILIQLTSSVPRNISPDCAAMICQDLEALAQALGDDLSFDNVQGLHFMDALPMYQLVLTRLSKWTEQIERRKTTSTSVGGAGRKRRRAETSEAPEGTTHNLRPARRDNADRDDSGLPESGGGVESDEDNAELPSRPESRAANRRAESRHGGIVRKPATPPGGGRRWSADSIELPAFGLVSHVFTDPIGNAKDFEALITVLRQCVGTACMSCGERRTWSGVYNRFRSKWVKGMQSKSDMPESIAIYSDIQDYQRQGQYYAIMDAIDSYLCE